METYLKVFPHGRKCGFSRHVTHNKINDKLLEINFPGMNNLSNISRFAWFIAYK